MSHEVLKYRDGQEINKLQTNKEQDLLSGDYLNEVYSVKGIFSLFKSNEESALRILEKLNKRVEKNGGLLKHYLERLKNDIPNFVLTKKNEQEIAELDNLADHCNLKFDTIMKSNFSPSEKISVLHQELTPIFTQIEGIIRGIDSEETPLDLN